MTPGSLSIKSESAPAAAPWIKSRRDAYLAIAAVGVLAGIAVALARTPWQLPGHKVLYWMIPVLAVRLRTRTRAGVTTGSFTTAITTLSLGGRIAGGVLLTPLVIVGGVILDAAANHIRRRQWPAWRALILLAFAGMAANLLCCVKRLSDLPAPQADMAFAIGSYAIFGFAAGLIGAGLGYGVSRHRRTAI